MLSKELATQMHSRSIAWELFPRMEVFDYEQKLKPPKKFYTETDWSGGPERPAG
jgi:hypothetical protein